MKIRTYMMVSSAGNVRVNKTGAGLRPNELAIVLNLDIPDSFFRRPVPVVNLEIPHHVGEAISVDQVIDLTAEQVAESLGVTVENVRDGLRLALMWEPDEGGEG